MSNDSKVPYNAFYRQGEGTGFEMTFSSTNCDPIFDAHLRKVQKIFYTYILRVGEGEDIQFNAEDFFCRELS